MSLNKNMIEMMRRQQMINDLPWMKKRSRLNEQKEKWKRRFLNLSWQSEAVKVIKAKLKHYEETGNENKARIYRLKLKHQGSLLDKLKEAIK